MSESLFECGGGKVGRGGPGDGRNSCGHQSMLAAVNTTVLHAHKVWHGYGSSGFDGALTLTVI